MAWARAPRIHAGMIGLGGCALVAAAGCGGSAPGSNGNQVTPIPLEEASREFAAAICAKFLACCDAAEIRTAEVGLDEATCSSGLAGDPNVIFVELAPAIGAGRVVYHGDKARRCLDWLAALPCAQWGGDMEFSRSADCRAIFEGTVTSGACQMSEECLNGTCPWTGSDGGVCRPSPQLGESCAATLCARDLYCPTDGTSEICQAPKADGQPCNGGFECTSRYCGDMDSAGLRWCGPPVFCNGV